MSKTTRLIPLTQGKFAIVDEIDYEWLNQWKWYAARQIVLRNSPRWYVARGIWIGDGKIKTILMHRDIADHIGLQSRYYDHKDHDGLNNTRDNIRPCSQSQNLANTRKWSGCTSKYKGVTWHRMGKWQAQITKGGRYFYLGCFDSEADAAAAYLDTAIKLYGEFASVL